MTKTTSLLRYASDMPFSKGMILADEFGATVTVEAVTPGDRVTLTGGWNYSAKLVRGSYQFLVCTTEVLEDEADEDEGEAACPFLVEGVDTADGSRTELARFASSGEARLFLIRYVARENAGNWDLIEVYDTRGEDTRLLFWEREDEPLVDGQDDAEGDADLVEALAEAAQHEDLRSASCVSDCSDEDREDGLYWRATAGEAEAYFATEAEAHAWVEAERVEALAEAAQHEDDLRQAVLDRAEEEWQRKNLGFVFSEA